MNHPLRYFDRPEAQRKYMARTANIYRHMCERARKLHAAPPDFGLDNMREYVRSRIGRPCGWCDTVLSIGNFCPDHSTPIAQGGTFFWSNIDIVCGDCNLLKGNMTAEGFIRLLELRDQLSPRDRGDLDKRLKSHGMLQRMVGWTRKK